MEVSVLQLLMTPRTTDRTNVHLPTVEVQIPPSEPKQLALPKAGRRVHKDQDARQWTHSAQKLPDFIDKKDVRYPAALGALPNELDGIIIKQFVSASMIKQHAHDVLDLRARRARQGKLT
jgi:hypothetical protein